MAKRPEHVEEFALWRAHMVDHLKERGDQWVRDGKLMLRKHGMALSPNFPGYAPQAKVNG